MQDYQREKEGRKKKDKLKVQGKYLFSIRIYCVSLLFFSFVFFIVVLPASFFFIVFNLLENLSGDKNFALELFSHTMFVNFLLYFLKGKLGLIGGNELELL